MKKRFLGLIASACLIAVFALTGCGGAANTTKRTATETLGASAVSTVRLLGTGLAPEAVGALAEASGETGQTEQPAQTEENPGQTEEKTEKNPLTEKFDKYFRAFDGFTGADAVKTEVSDNTDGRYAYSKVMTISGTGADGEQSVYTMYYDETVVKTETDDGETETEYALSGVMIVGEKEYAIEGERSEETEEGEREDELKIRAYATSADRTTYVEMKKEVGTETGETETEYVYKVYRDGKLVEEVVIEFETEKSLGGEKSEYEIELRRGETVGKFKVERFTENGKTVIEVQYFVGVARGKFRVNVTTDASGKEIYEYVFSSGV